MGWGQLNDRKNSEGYYDPTTHEAIKNLNREEEKAHKLLRTIFHVCELAGFRITGNITLVDKKSGRVWK
jgi:hypothetical protein